MSTGDVRIDTADGIPVVRLSGEIDFSNAASLNTAICDAIDRARCALFDLSAVVYIDSTFIGLLVNYAKRMHKRGGELVLIVPPAPIRRLLEIVKVTQVIRTFETAEEAYAYALTVCVDS